MLQIIFLTVGEKVSFKSLEALKEMTKEPYKLTIWYDACGHEIDEEFRKELLKYSEDLIVLTENHGAGTAIAFGMLYLPGSELLVVLADTVVQEGYLERLRGGFGLADKVACVGCARIDDHPEFKPHFNYTIDDQYFMPDGVVLFSRDGINVLGSFSPRFGGHGMIQREWYDRALAYGWHIVSASGVMKEIGTTHDGRVRNKDLKGCIERSNEVYLDIKNNGYRDFTWWAA